MNIIDKYKYEAIIKLFELIQRKRREKKKIKNRYFVSQSLVLNLSCFFYEPDAYLRVHSLYKQRKNYMII